MCELHGSFCPCVPSRPMRVSSAASQSWCEGDNVSKDLLIFEEAAPASCYGCSVPSIHSLTEDASHILWPLVFSTMRWIE